MAYTSKAKFWRSQVRIPQAMIDWIKGRSEISCRSLNAEIVEVIRETMERRKNEPANPA